MISDGRPVYRFDGAAKVYADTGDLVRGRHGRRCHCTRSAWVPQYGSTVLLRWLCLELRSVDARRTARGTMPLHRIAVGDPAGTHYYISEVTGEPTMKTDRRSRVLGFVSAVLHWTYFTSFRRNQPLWLQSVAWAATLGAVMTLMGLIVGIVRTRCHRHYRMRAVRRIRRMWAG